MFFFVEFLFNKFFLVKKTKQTISKMVIQTKTTVNAIATTVITRVHRSTTITTTVLRNTTVTYEVPPIIMVTAKVHAMMVKTTTVEMMYLSTETGTMITNNNRPSNYRGQLTMT